MIRRLFAVDGQTWYGVSRRFRTEGIARGAWERLDREGKRADGALELGAYRHGPSGEPATIVTVVGHRREGVEVADRILGGGVENELHDDLWRALVMRRARVMVELLEAGAEPGSHVIRRPPSRGATLNPDGTMDEPIGRG